MFTVILIAAGIVYYRAFDPDKFGFYHDDGIYVVTAKALAARGEYRIISLPGEPFQTKYPPVYPLALSVLWRIDSRFPDNLPLLYATSAVAMLVFLAVGAAYIVRQGYATSAEAPLILLFSAFNFRSVILASSTLSDALYAALSICALWFADSRAGKRGDLFGGAALGGTLVLVTLTRISGVALWAAVLLRSLVGRQLGRVYIPSCIMAAALAGWIVWCHGHHSGGGEGYYTSYLQDWLAMLQSSVAGERQHLIVAAGTMAAKNILAVTAAIPLVCLGIRMNWYQGLSDAELVLAVVLGLSVLTLIIAGFVRTHTRGNGLLHYYCVAYVGLHLFWPYGIFDRFLVPLLPFLLLFLVRGGRLAWTEILRLRGTGPRLAPATLAIISCFTLPAAVVVAGYRSSYGLYKDLAQSKARYAETARENKEVLAWLRANTNPRDTLGCYRDPLYYLHSGRTAVRFPTPSAAGFPQADADRMMRFVDENNVRAVICTPADFELESEPVIRRDHFGRLLEERPDDFEPVFTTRSGASRVYRVHLRTSDRIHD